METKKIELNTKYYVKINYNDKTRLYILKDREDKTIMESYSRDSFLLKLRQFTKITNIQELIIASI